jgi:hypothetical protein
MLRLVRRLFGLLKFDRETNAMQRPAVLRRLQTACIREQVRHEIRSTDVRVRT